MDKEIKNLLARIDHTNLSRIATIDAFKNLCEEAKEFGVASVCVPPNRVEECVAHMGELGAVCTVVGFPNGYTLSDAKTNEAKLAIQLGAKEIDMVVDVSKVKEGQYLGVLLDIRRVRDVLPSPCLLKVIIETHLLTTKEKIEMCKVVSESGADFIKTSTGFVEGGATFEDVSLLREHCKPHVKVKAAGGINSLDDAFKFVDLGADRLGTSKIIKLVKGLSGEGY